MGNFFLKKNRVFTIAEFGSNHVGNINLAFDAILSAKKAQADSIKFQSINLKEIYTSIPKNMSSIKNKIEVDNNWYEKLFIYSRKTKIDLSFSVIYENILEILKKQNPKFYKVASPQVYGHPHLIDLLAKTKKPLLFSSGYCEIKHLDRAIQICKKNNHRNYAILHCTAEYPTQIKNLNLNFIKTLKKRYGCPIGFSDHTKGTHISKAAVALGADIIEKHVRLKNTPKSSPDYSVSILFDELKLMIKEINEIKKSLGKFKKKLSNFELKNRESLVVYPHYKSKLIKDTKIKIEHISHMRTGNKIKKKITLDMIINKITKKNVKKNQLIKTSDFK
jgi:sialic acid synthase SpsE